MCLGCCWLHLIRYTWQRRARKTLASLQEGMKEIEKVKSFGNLQSSQREIWASTLGWKMLPILNYNPWTLKLRQLWYDEGSQLRFSQEQIKHMAITSFVKTLELINVIHSTSCIEQRAQRKETNSVALLRRHDRLKRPKLSAGRGTCRLANKSCWNQIGKRPVMFLSEWYHQKIPHGLKETVISWNLGP